jgi:tetratricopeptide (TPR) repeat protein
LIYRQRQQADAVLACADRVAAHWAMVNIGPREQAVTIRLRGVGHELKGNYLAAIAAYGETLQLLRRVAAESVDVTTSLNDLASAEQLAGDYGSAETHYREALDMARTMDYAEGGAIYIGNLATLALDRGDWLRAETLAREALPLSEAIHRQELIAGDNLRLAIALLRQDKASEALLHARRAVDIFNRLSHPDLTKAQVTLAECSG